jgi:putative ABC transport system permease protein
VALKGVPVEKLKPPSGVAWVLEGDRGITYSEAVPAGSHLTEGAWWPANYESTPLVSFEADIAKALGLKLGDSVTVNVLGRNLTAKIANFRKVRWGSIGINFVMVFSPNVLRDAPFTWLGTLEWPESKPHAGQEVEALRAIAAQFSTVSAIRVHDVLDAITRVFEKVMAAVRIAGAVTLLMGLVVVAGALSTAQRRRLKDGVILRVLGASRWRIMAAHLLEYAVLALSLAVIAGALGALVAWLVARFVMEIGFIAPAWALLQPSFVETIFVLGLGAIGTFKVFSAKPASWLRSE